MPADAQGSVQHVTLEGVPVDVLVKVLTWFSQVKEFECLDIHPPAGGTVCAHVQCGSRCTGRVYIPITI